MAILALLIFSLLAKYLLHSPMGPGQHCYAGSGILLYLTLRGLMKVVLEVVLRWMSFILPVTGTQQVQELQDRSRTFRGITRMIRSSSWTTFKRFQGCFRGV